MFKTDYLCRHVKKARVSKAPKEVLKPSRSASKLWEEFLFLFCILPVWFSGIMTYATFFRTISTSLLKEAETVDTLIPEIFFMFLSLASLLIWGVLSKCLTLPLPSKYREQHQFTLKMGIRLLFSCMAMGVLSLIEKSHRGITIRESYLVNLTTILEMSAMLLLPQICMLSVAITLNCARVISMLSEINSESDIHESFSTNQMLLPLVVSGMIQSTVKGIASSGLSGSWLLVAGFSLLNFLYFVVCCRVSGIRMK
ncbi:hypothetical protein GIB67_002481 [Kingdonia uniflora]|uniref:Uncharacterized protein n=1 Tax=Kingdonia uniflora TaxID=39325 RepID=A0A7J7LAI2_9MAGN|nr:hypothetical protein GIB67_002481 [Kingdonia uniflora]